MKNSTHQVRPIRRFAIALAATASMALGCSAGAGLSLEDDQEGQTAGDGVPTTGTGGGYNQTGTGGSGGGAYPQGSGEWCAVEDLLEAQCHNCHGPSPRFGAPMSLVTPDDLWAPATDGRPLYEVALERVQATVEPMPPPPSQQLTPDQIGTLQSWVDAGVPAGNCNVVTGTGGTINGTGGTINGTGGGVVTGGTGGTVVTGGTGGSGGTDECIDCGDYSCENGTPIRFLAHQNTTPGDTTPFDATNVGSTGNPNSYECFYFQAPWGATTQSIGHRPVIDNDRILHHWLLYASEEAPLDITDGGRKSGCQLQSDPNRVLLAGWAPGSPGGNLPPDVGQALPLGNRTFVTLEVHYYNTNPGTPAVDRSGVEVCLTDNPRPNEATQHWLGTENINIPAGSQATAGDTCTPNLAAGQTSTILNVWPHMHLLGTRMSLEVIRQNGAREMVHDGAFAFDNQTIYKVDPPVTIFPGDRLETKCYYENSTGAPVVFGEGSNEEMCYMFTRAYPAGSLHNGKNGCFAGLCVPGGINRCIDNENILTAIGGL